MRLRAQPITAAVSRLDLERAFLVLKSRVTASLAVGLLQQAGACWQHACRWPLFQMELRPAAPTHANWNPCVPTQHFRMSGNVRKEGMHVSGCERELPLHSCTLLLLPRLQASKAATSLQLQVCKCQQGAFRPSSLPVVFQL